MVFNLNTIYSHSFPIEKIKPDKNEVLRYMGQRGEPSPEITQLMDNISKNTLTKASPKGAFVIRQICVSNADVKIGNKIFYSENLSKNLFGCSEAVIFVLSLGADSDRAIFSKKASSPLEALAVSSLFTEVLEKYADEFVGELKSIFEADGKHLRPRYSPGYGDFSIENQPYFISETDAARRCGVSVTDSLLLTPSKSITGIIGIGDSNL